MEGIRETTRKDIELVHTPSQESYRRAQELAEEAGKPCWELFGCPVTHDDKFGVLCKGNCPT